MPRSEAVLEAMAVTRRFGYRPVVRDAHLTLEPGEALLLIGANGSGKTTLLRVLAGLLKPSSGTVARRAITEFVGHEAMVYDALSARENLRFFARLRGPADRRRIDALLERLGLADRRDDRAGTYSRGMLQRLSLARALLPDPGLLLLDEPLTGLDVETTPILLTLLHTLREGGTAMVIVSHQLEGLDAVATRRARMRDGVFVEDGATDA